MGKELKTNGFKIKKYTRIEHRCNIRDLLIDKNFFFKNWITKSPKIAQVV